MLISGSRAVGGLSDVVRVVALSISLGAYIYVGFSRCSHKPFVTNELWIHKQTPSLLDRLVDRRLLWRCMCGA